MFTVNVVPGTAVVISVVRENAVVVVVSASTVDVEIDVTTPVLVAVTSTSGTVLKTVLVTSVVKLACCARSCQSGHNPFIWSIESCAR